MSSRGMFRYDFITVSSARELTSVSMRYSQGGLGLCTVRTISIALCVRWSFRSVPFLCRVYSYLPRHDHVLPGTLIIKIMRGNQLYLQG